MLRRIGSAVLGLALIAAAPSGLAQGTAEPTSESQRAPEAGEQSQRAPDAGEKAGGDQTASQPADADRLISAINAIEGAIRDLVFDENPEARKRQERRDEADLRAQQDMALWALRMFWAAIGSLGLTFVGIVLIGITLFYTKEAAQAAKASVDEATKGTAAAAQAAAAALEANKLNRDVFVAEQRAWIAIKSVQIVSSLEWPNRYGKASIKFILRNIGRTPAKNVWINAQLCISGPVEAHALYAKIATSSRKTRVSFGYTMFPDEQISQVHELKISEDDLRAYFGEDDGWSEEIAVFPTLVGCVNYALVLEQEKRQTGFIMNVIRRSDANGVIAIGPAFGDVPVEQLELQRHVLGDIIAD